MGTPSKVATVNPEATVAIAELVLCSGTILVAITGANAKNAAWLSEETTRPASNIVNEEGKSAERAVRGEQQRQPECQELAGQPRGQHGHRGSADHHAERVDGRIGELTRKTGVHERLLRYYKAPKPLQAERRPSGYREYNEADVDTVRRIPSLLAVGLNTATIATILSCLCDDGERLVPTCSSSEVAEGAISDATPNTTR